jgi:hypothetical protein
MVVRPIAAGPHLILNYQLSQPHGSPARPGQSVGLTIRGQAEPAGFAHGARSHSVSLLPFSRHNDADALAAVAVLRRLADLIEDAAAPEVAGNLFRREGEYWTVRYDGLVARLTDAKGLRLLARLLADPGREFHAIDLEAAGGRAARPAPPGPGGLRVRPDLGDAGELLDAKAKAAYKARLDELAAELEEAGARHGLRWPHPPAGLRELTQGKDFHETGHAGQAARQQPGRGARVLHQEAGLRSR